MKKMYFLLFALIMGTSVNAQVDITVDLIDYTSLEATSDDPLTLDFYVINNGVDIPTGDTIVVALLITDWSTYINNYTVDNLTSGSVSLLVLTQDFLAGDTIPITGTAAMDMQWIYTEAGETNMQVCGNAAVGLNMFQTGAGDDNFTDNADCVDYTVTWVTGVDENGLSAFNVYPNPASNNVTFDLGQNAIDQIQILDLSGRVVDVITVTNSIESLDVSNYEDGVYFYSLIQGDAVLKTEKLVVSK